MHSVFPQFMFYGFVVHFDLRRGRESKEKNDNHIRDFDIKPAVNRLFLVFLKGFIWGGGCFGLTF